MKPAAPSFYQSIADYYDRIFPFQSVQLDFVERQLPQPKTNARILDIGCGTGSLAIALAQRGHLVTAVDRDHAMLELAGEKARRANASVTWSRLDMQQLEALEPQARFHAITVFGNTLVHLTSWTDIQHLFVQAHQRLLPEGVLLLQLINYDNVMAMEAPGLPSIETDEVHFSREYAETDDGLLQFNTCLTIKGQQRQLTNSTLLLPVRVDELEDGLFRAGYAEVGLFSGFDSAPLSSEALPLVVVAQKGDHG